MLKASSSPSSVPDSSSAREPRDRLAGLRNRTIVLGQSFEHFPAEIEPLAVDIGPFEPRQHTNRVRIMVKPALIHHRSLQRIFARMAERRMADIMRKAQCFGQILVEAKQARYRPADLRDLQTVRQPDTIMIAVGRDKHLRFRT